LAVLEVGQGAVEEGLWYLLVLE